MLLPKLNSAPANLEINSAKFANSTKAQAGSNNSKKPANPDDATQLKKESI